VTIVIPNDCQDFHHQFDILRTIHVWHPPRWFLLPQVCPGKLHNPLLGSFPRWTNMYDGVGDRTTTDTAARGITGLAALLDDDDDEDDIRHELPPIP
jgi:hypothetical protein